MSSNKDIEQQERIEDLEERLSTVFYHITGGRISKPYTAVRPVLGVCDDLQTEEVEKAEEKARTEAKRELVGEMMDDCGDPEMPWMTKQVEGYLASFIYRMENQ